jgi:hypothetical protein
MVWDNSAEREIGGFYGVFFLLNLSETGER